MVEGLPLIGLTAPTLLGLAILLLLTGRLVPRRTYDDARKDRDDWKAAHGESEELRRQLLQNLQPLMESAQATEAMMRAITNGNHQDGGP